MYCIDAFSKTNAIQFLQFSFPSIYLATIDAFKEIQPYSAYFTIKSICSSDQH